MLLLKYLTLVAGFGMFVFAAAIIIYDLFHAEKYRRLFEKGEKSAPPKPVRWGSAGKLMAWACLPLLMGSSFVVVPSGMAGVRISQWSGTRPGTLYPGAHFVKPVIERVVLYDTREQVFSTEAVQSPAKTGEALKVQAHEGLVIGLAIAVRYRLDAKRLDFIQDNVPQSVEEEVVRPAVASAFHSLVPNYTVRDVFASKREELLQRAREEITRKLGTDAILVKEVMVRDIKLPDEYAKGLEGLLLKEQENERMGVETDIRQKQVRIAELEAEAAKVRQVKRAEGDASVRVLQAKSESDAMQYTLPLKEKQIQQTRLEAEARKESTLKNAEAAAQAKVIDSKAELEKRKLMAEAESERIRLTAVANAERMRSEAIVLKQNPLLINKIIAEKLSDKVQIMMVPSDGKFFLTNDLLRGAPVPTGSASTPDDAPDEWPAAQPSASR